MEATLYEVLNLGRSIHKHYRLEEPETVYGKPVENFVIVYNDEDLTGEVINLDNDDILALFNLKFYDKEIDYDVVLDKYIMRNYLSKTSIKIYKECDDYSDNY